MVEVSVEHRVYIVVYESELDDDAVASEEELASQEQMDSVSSLRLPDERELQYSLSSPSVASEQAGCILPGCRGRIERLCNLGQDFPINSHSSSVICTPQNMERLTCATPQKAMRGAMSANEIGQ